MSSDRHRAAGATPRRRGQELLQRLLRFNTVNPPGNERAAQEYLADHLKAGGLRVRAARRRARAPEPAARGCDGRERRRGRRSATSGHVDTVLADPAEWTHDPWSGDLADGYLWGRGALDMKSQVAAEVAAAASLARSGWRPARGELLIAAVVDEETGGELGAEWITKTHPEKVRCDLLVNEGGGAVFEYAGRRCYGVCCAEKGVFRFTVTTDGVAGHASMPGMGENALLKMGPVLERLAARQPSYELTAEPQAFLRGIGEDPDDPAGIDRASARRRPAPGDDVRADARRDVHADAHQGLGEDQRDPQPRRAESRLPRAARAWARRRCDGGSPRCSATRPGWLRDRVHRARGRQPLADGLAADGRDLRVDLRAAIPGAEVVPVILPGFTDSRHFREAFPECVAYGFFPQRHQSLLAATPLIHAADERIDVRDLAVRERVLPRISPRACSAEAAAGRCPPRSSRRVPEDFVRPLQFPRK